MAVYSNAVIGKPEPISGTRTPAKAAPQSEATPKPAVKAASKAAAKSAVKSAKK